MSNKDVSNKEKQDIINSIVPRAVLKAITPEAKQAITYFEEHDDLILLHKFPFNIGRETRTQLINGQLEVMERRKSHNSKPNNDVYLMDNSRLLQISREHLVFERKNNTYIVRDRGSACGINIGNDHIGGKDSGGSHTVKDGDIIGIGVKGTPYLFKFIVLNDE